MYELQHNGQIYLFTTEKKAKKYAKENGFGTYAIFPPNTLTSQPEFED